MAFTLWTVVNHRQCEVDVVVREEVVVGFAEEAVAVAVEEGCMASTLPVKDTDLKRPHDIEREVAVKAVKEGMEWCLMKVI